MHEDPPFNINLPTEYADSIKDDQGKLFSKSDRFLSKFSDIKVPEQKPLEWTKYKWEVDPTSGEINIEKV